MKMLKRWTGARGIFRLVWRRPRTTGRSWRNNKRLKGCLMEGWRASLEASECSWWELRKQRNICLVDWTLLASLSRIYASALLSCPLSSPLQSIFKWSLYPTGQEGGWHQRSGKLYASSQHERMTADLCKTQLLCLEETACFLAYLNSSSVTSWEVFRRRAWGRRC